jgi:hypothetical protein
MARRPDPLSTFADRHEIVRGDVTDPASLAEQPYYSLVFRGKQLDHLALQR